MISSRCAPHRLVAHRLVAQGARGLCGFRLEALEAGGSGGSRAGAVCQMYWYSVFMSRCRAAGQYTDIRTQLQLHLSGVEDPSTVVPQAVFISCVVDVGFQDSHDRLPLQCPSDIQRRPPGIIDRVQIGTTPHNAQDPIREPSICCHHQCSPVVW